MKSDGKNFILVCLFAITIALFICLGLVKFSEKNTDKNFYVLNEKWVYYCGGVVKDVQIAKHPYYSETWIVIIFSEDQYYLLNNLKDYNDIGIGDKIKVYSRKTFLSNPKSYFMFEKVDTKAEKDYTYGKN